MSKGFEKLKQNITFAKLANDISPEARADQALYKRITEKLEKIRNKERENGT